MTMRTASAHIRYVRHGGTTASRKLPQFEAMMAQFEKGGATAGGPFGAGGPGSAISDWVKQHYPSRKIGGRTAYDLTTPLL